MIEKLLINELKKDEHLITMFLSSIILLFVSVFFNNFFGYICGLGGIAYGMAFMYYISKSENKILKYGGKITLGILFIFLIYFMFLNVKPDLYGLIFGLIVIIAPIFFINKKFFPVIIPLNVTLSGITPQISYTGLIPIISDLIKAHPIAVISAGIVAIYMFFKMAKDIIKIIILTVIVWAVLRFLVGLI